MFKNLGNGLGRMMALDASHRRSAGQVAILRNVIDVTEGDDAELCFGAKRVNVMWFTATRRRILGVRVNNSRCRS